MKESYIFCFSIVTKPKVYFVQTPNEKELHDWLYAINPLLAGQIRYHNVKSIFIYATKIQLIELIQVYNFIISPRSSTGHNRPKVTRSMSRKSTLSVSGATEHVGTSHIPSNATPSAEKSAGLYDK